MSNATIQRQYDELIADKYDLDPQSINSNALDGVVQLLFDEGCLAAALPTMDVLDLGMGTGVFFEKLRGLSARELRPFGIDISERMLAIARRRIRDLQYRVDDAANLDKHFADQSFDLICTHFITGFVPLEHLAPRIWSMLKPGGYWTFLGATSEAYPTMRKKAESRLVQMILGNKRLDMSSLLTPANAAEVAQCFEANGFTVRECSTLEPQLAFEDFDDFMQFAYHGGWLTPFIEELGLQNARPPLRLLLNTFVFPMTDHHTIAIGLAQKPD